jgi:hypothetical protein
MNQVSSRMGSVRIADIAVVRVYPRNKVSSHDCLDTT